MPYNQAKPNQTKNKKLLELKVINIIQWTRFPHLSLYNNQKRFYRAIKINRSWFLCTRWIVWDMIELYISTRFLDKQ